MRKHLVSVLVLLASVFGVTAVLAPSASAESSPSSYGSRLIQLINSARADHGLRALTVTSGTSTVAYGWTQHLAAQHSLSHNPNLQSQLESHGSANWTSYGENVGEAPTSSAQSLFNAYMNSPEHRANILGSSYRFVGVGVVFAGGTAWNTLDFVDQYSGATQSTSSSTTTRTTTATTTHTVHRTATAPSRPVVQQHVTATPAHRSARPTRAHHARHASPVIRVKAVASSLPVATAPVDETPILQTAIVPTAHHGAPSKRAEIPFLVALGVLAAAACRFAIAMRTRNA